jgi:hypothetical protein
VLAPFVWLFKAVFKVIFFFVRPIVSFFLPSPQTTAADNAPDETDSIE